MGSQAWFLALCPAGKKPVGGGYEVFGGAGPQLSAIASHPFNNGAGQLGWRIQLRNNTSAPITTTVRVHVVCALAQ
jgi:hypothetical protein